MVFEPPGYVGLEWTQDLESASGYPTRHHETKGIFTSIWFTIKNQPFMYIPREKSTFHVGKYTLITWILWLSLLQPRKMENKNWYALSRITMSGS